MFGSPSRSPPAATSNSWLPPARHPRSRPISSGYDGQFRLRFPEQPPSGLRPFMTFGAIGLVFHSPRCGTDVSAPLITLIGGGMEKRVLRRLIVRGEAQ